MLTSSADPDLSLFKSLPETAIVVPAHLAQEGWIYEVGYGERAQLVASTGVLAASEISTVLTRIRRGTTPSPSNPAIAGNGRRLSKSLC